MAGLSVATVLTSWRLFSGWSWLPVLVCAAVLSHLIGALTRRAGWSAVASLGVSLVALVLFVSIVQFRDTTFLGLPTRATWEAAQLQLRAAWDSFPTAIAPVVPTGGFITAVILLVWLLAYAADDFAHRAEAPIEAAVPSGVLFLVGTALGGNRNRLLATALWLAAAALTVAILRVERSEGAGWFGGTRRRAVSTTVRVGAGLAAAAVIVGVIAGPALPGASSDPLVDTRQGRSSRTTLSPLVDIQARLVNQSDEELFTVASPRPAYWRLTALDDYDLRIWRSSRSYGDASGTLSGGLRDDLGTPLDHTIQITGLDSVWLPTAFAPRSISIPDQVRYDAESGSLLIRPQLAAGRAHLRADLGRAERGRRDGRGHRGRGRPAARDRRPLPRPAVQLPGPLPPAGRADHRQRHDALRQGAGAPELVPDELHLRPQRRRPATARPPSTRSSRSGAGTASSSPGPTPRSPARSACRRGWRSASPRAISAPTACTTCAVATRTPGPRSTCPASAGWPSSPPPAAASRAPRATPACPRRRTAAPRRPRLDRAVHRDDGGARHADGRPQGGDRQRAGAGRAEPRRRRRRRWSEPGLDGLAHRPRPRRAGDHRADRPRRAPSSCASVSGAGAGAARPRPADQVLVSWQHTRRRPAAHRRCEIAPSETPHEVALRVGPLARSPTGRPSTTQELGELADQATGGGVLRRPRRRRPRPLRGPPGHAAAPRRGAARPSPGDWCGASCPSVFVLEAVTQA